MCSEGFSFEQSYIEHYLTTTNVHPLTRRLLTNADLKPNRVLRDVCMVTAKHFGREPGWGSVDFDNQDSRHLRANINHFYNNININNFINNFNTASLRMLHLTCAYLFEGLHLLWFSLVAALCLTATFVVAMLVLVLAMLVVKQDKRS